MSGITQTPEEKAAEAKAAKAAKAAEKVKAPKQKATVPVVSQVDPAAFAEFVRRNYYVYCVGKNKKLCITFDGRFIVIYEYTSIDEKGGHFTEQRNTYVGKNQQAAVNAYNKLP
jgi:hypothetical protein